MLIQSISQYLESHKRLVIPQLGTFIVKEPGRSILFSELLKRDDGVLRGLLREAGLGELEAAGEIDRFVFEARHAVQSGEEYPLEGFGVLKPGANGTIAFAYDPTLRVTDAAETEVPAKEPTVPESVAAPAAAAASEPPVRRPEPRDDSGDAGAVRPVPEQTPAGAESEPSVPTAAEHPRMRPRRVQADQVARSVEQAFAEPYVSPSAKMNPDPSVRGLRYGKPPKSTNAYTYVDRPMRRHADRFLWVAIAAAVIALSAIAFGYWREQREKQAEAEYLEYRQMIDDPSAAQESAPAADVESAQTE